MSRESVVELIKTANKLYGKSKGDDGFISRLKSDTEDILKEKLIAQLVIVIDTDSDPLTSDECSEDLAEFLMDNKLVGEDEEEDEIDSDEEVEDVPEVDDEEDDDESDEEDEEDEGDSEVDDQEEDFDDAESDEDEDPVFDEATEIDLSGIALMIEKGFSKILEAIQANGVVSKPRKRRGGPKGLSDEAQTEYDLKLEAAKDKAVEGAKRLFATHTTLEELQALVTKQKVTTTSASISGLKQAIKSGMVKRAQAKVTKEFQALVEA